MTTLNGMTYEELLGARMKVTAVIEACDFALGLDDRLNLTLGSTRGHASRIRTDIDYFITQYEERLGQI